MTNYWREGIELVLIIWLWSNIVISLIKLIILFVYKNKNNSSIAYNTRKIISWIIIWVVSQSIAGFLFFTSIDPLLRITAFLIIATFLNWVLFQIYKKKIDINEYESSLIYIFLYFPVVINALRRSLGDHLHTSENN